MKAPALLLALSVVASAAMAQNAGEKPCCGAKRGTQKSAAQKEAEFLAEANRMLLQSEDKEACCRTTAAKPVAKTEEGCCNAKGEPAKFKVFVAGQGYRFFGCEGSAKEGRAELIAANLKVGPVQKVTGKASL